MAIMVIEGMPILYILVAKERLFMHHFIDYSSFRVAIFRFATGFI